MKVNLTLKTASREPVMKKPISNETLNHKISRGHLVNIPNNTNSNNLFMKAEREGTEYIHHYL